MEVAVTFPERQWGLQDMVQPDRDPAEPGPICRDQGVPGAHQDTFPWRGLLGLGHGELRGTACQDPSSALLLGEQGHQLTPSV